MMCEDGIGVTFAEQGEVRGAPWPFRGASLRPAFQIIAVSGEVTLHHEQLYVQICQPATGCDSGILIRTCRGRKDYTGGRNHFAPLSLLDDIPVLALRCSAVLQQGGAP